MNREEDGEHKKTDKPVDDTRFWAPATDTAVFACGFIPVLFVHPFLGAGWESFFGVSSVFVQRKEEGEALSPRHQFPQRLEPNRPATPVHSAAGSARVSWG